MKKLKSIDFKALFINHGEKFGLGLIVVIVLWALSGTSWSRYPSSPEELKIKITAAKDRITSPANKWPQAKADQFVIVDYNGKAQEVFTGLQTAKYEFTTPMFWPLYRKKEKAREPDLSVPQYLIATPGLAVLSVNTMPDGQAVADSTDASKATDLAASDSTLKPAPGSSNPATAAGPAAPFGINPATAHAKPPASGSRPGPGPGAAGMHGGGGPGMIPGMMPGMEGIGGTAGAVARGKRYIAIRAVVPIKEQIERAMKALNMSYADASNAIIYTDFTLERQTAVAGSDPWSGEWTEVDRSYALEALKESSDFDQDPVPLELQDAAITMPLPLRLLRYWADDATHPNIKNFQLSEAEMERERTLHSKMVEEVEKLNLQTQPKGPRKHGFLESGAVNDMRGMGRALLASSENQNVMQNMMKSMNDGTGPRMGVPDLQSRLTASGRLFLFRYFDFDVQPGMAYRYRLKLQLANPNFERSYEEVENADFTKGEYRETAWSNISNPAVVPDTVNYFLKDVERDPNRDDKHSKKPIANIAMFEWNADLGTMLSDSLKILNVGQFIAEKKKSLVLDPATPSFEERDVAFTTEDVLVDASGDLELAPELHPDLQLKADRNRKEARLGLLPEALVAKGTGQLAELDPLSRNRDEAALKQKVEEERKNFQYLKDKPKESASALDAAAYPGMPIPGMPAPGPSGRGKNPLKKGGSAGPGAAGPAGSQSGGMHSGGGTQPGGKSKK